MRRHPNVGSLRLLPCPHLQGLPRDMLTEPLCRTDPGLPVSHLRTPRCLPRMWIWRMVAGVRKSLRETMSCFWGVRNLPWARALGYPRGMTRLDRPEDAPFKGSREKLKESAAPRALPGMFCSHFFVGQKKSAKICFSKFFSIDRQTAKRTNFFSCSCYC